MNLFLSILRILFGLLFIASGIVKLFPIDAFEMVLIQQVGVSWGFAPLMARSLVVVEILLGSSIALGFQTKKMLLLSEAMLAAFTVFLFVQVLGGKGGENCGCFGELIPMDAPTSIAKNFVFMAFGLALIWKVELLDRLRLSWLGPVLALISIPIIFLALPLPEGDLDKEATVNSELISDMNTDMKWDLESDKKLMVLMYAKCIHCKQLAILLSTLDDKVAQENLRILIFGTDELVFHFVEDSKIQHLQFERTTNRKLLQAIDGKFPSAILVQDGVVESNWTGSEVNMDLLSTILED